MTNQNFEINKQFGCFQIARSLFNNEIWLLKPAWWNKIWIYILGKVQFKDIKICKRGEGFFTYDQIYYECKLINDGVKTSHSVGNVIKWLKSTTQITTRKTTRGFYIIIGNYALYQNISNYKNYTENYTKNDSKTTQERHRNDTIYNNDKNDRMNINNKQYIEYINFWNFVFKRKYKPIEALLPNFNYWVKIYSLDEIKKAIEVAHTDKFWADKMKPVILLRRKNPQGEAVDYIGGFINKERKWKKIGGDFNG